MPNQGQKHKFDDSLFWLDKANCHSISIAMLAISSLLDFTEPAAAFSTLHKSYLQSELAAMCRERANLAVAGLGDVHEYWVRFSRQSSEDQGTLRFTELRGAQSFVNALPAPTRSKVLAPVAGVDEHTGFWKLAKGFSEHWLQGSPAGLEAISTLVALMSDQTPVFQARDSVDEHPIFGAIAYGDQKAKAPTQLSRTAVMAARKILKRNGYRKRNINNLAKDAEVWAAVWVRYSGSLDAAWQGGYQTWKKPNLSATIAPFNDALGMQLKRGPKLSARSDGSRSALTLDYGNFPKDQRNTFRSRDTRHDPPIPDPVQAPTDECTVCGGALESGSDNDGSFVHCLNCGRYWYTCLDLA